MLPVEVIPCLEDNYAYLLRLPGSRKAVIVDASEAAPVRAALEREALELVAILATHHHHDHVGGNEELLKLYPKARVFGYRTDAGRLPGLTDGVDDGATFEAAGLGFRALHIPGHTLGAVAYQTEDTVFTGDTLFVAGCGRLFEGTAAQMYDSLNEKLASLPDATRVFCGHEYTANNLKFAAYMEPTNLAIQEKAQRVTALRARGEPTVPSTIGEERLTNPFLRVKSPEILSRVADELAGDAHDPAAVLGAVCRAKEQYR
jgi:hydroxyacylglutathione hydrolase